MSSRERWTVYPLLFLAIGLAVRSAAVPPAEFAAARVDSLQATRMVCRELIVNADDGTILVHIGRVVGGGGGRIEVKDQHGVDAVSIGTRPGDRGGSVEFFDAEGEASYRIADTDPGHANRRLSPRADP